MSRKLKKILICILLITGVAINSKEILTYIGSLLVFQTELEPADAIVVLGGSSTGNRLLSGVKLYKEGYGKVIIFSGYLVYTNIYSHSLMRNLALKNGVPDKDIISRASTFQRSTWGEAASNLGLLKENNMRSFILVTSVFHTARSNIAYEKLNSELGYNLKFWVYPSPDSKFSVDNWWENLGAIKMFILEMVKNLSYRLEKFKPVKELVGK